MGGFENPQVAATEATETGLQLGPHGCRKASVATTWRPWSATASSPSLRETATSRPGSAGGSTASSEGSGVRWRARLSIPCLVR